MSARGASQDDLDVAAVYDRGVERYDDYRELWLRLAGAGAEAAMLTDLRAVLHPGSDVLDAGCGTGVLARKMLALYLVTGWFGLVGPAVAAMAIAMYVNDDPNASAGNAAFMTVLGLAFAMLALMLYRPLFGRPPTTGSADRASKAAVGRSRQVG